MPLETEGKALQFPLLNNEVEIEVNCGKNPEDKYGCPPPHHLGGCILILQIHLRQFLWFQNVGHWKDISDMNVLSGE